MKTKTAAALGINRLYHYQSFEKPERLTRILADRTLYFSKPLDFNDPWDCRPFYSKSFLDDPAGYDRAVQWFVHCDRTYNSALSEEEHIKREKAVRDNRKLLERLIEQMTPEMERAIQERYRVYCLSTHPDSVLMWAHYSASCRGVCLEFSAENELFGSSLEVAYLDSYPTFDVTASDEDQNLQPFLTKSNVWSYESEFRLIVSDHPFEFPDVPVAKAGLMSLPKGALRSVIIGAEMPTSDQEIVKTLVSSSERDISLKVASLVPNRYEFEIVDFKW